MAISSAVHPVRVEKIYPDHKVVKTVTIADPPITERSKRCSHHSKPNIPCPNCCVFSPEPIKDKKSILIHKEHPSNNSKTIQSDALPRRHSDDYVLTSTNHGNKQTKNIKSVGSANSSNKSIRNVTTITSNDKKSAQTTIQRSSSLKNPPRKPLIQANTKVTKDAKHDKRQSGESHSGNRTGGNQPKKTASSSKTHTKLPSNNITKVILILRQNYLSKHLKKLIYVMRYFMLFFNFRQLCLNLLNHRKRCVNPSEF